MTKSSAKPRAPRIVCLCGSTRFGEAFRQANLRETLAGHIVLSIGCDMRSDTEIFASRSEEERQQIKADLDELHFRKIDLADEILVLNVDGYVGASTRREIIYAKRKQKRVRWLEVPGLPSTTSPAKGENRSEIPAKSESAKEKPNLMNHPKEALLVRITGWSSPPCWYAGREDEVFEVYPLGRDFVLKEDFDRGPDAIWRHIDRCDCVEVDPDLTQGADLNPTLNDLNLTAKNDLDSPAKSLGLETGPEETLP